LCLILCKIIVYLMINFKIIYWGRITRRTGVVRSFKIDLIHRVRRGRPPCLTAYRVSAVADRERTGALPYRLKMKFREVVEMNY